MSWADALFRPRSVAVVGSVGEGKLGRILLDQLLDGGHKDLVAVNPKAAGHRGVPGVASLAEIDRGDQTIDLAVVASPASTVAGVLEDAGRAGVRTAIIIAAGFSEVGNREGELALLEPARRHGMRLIGPNCAGIVNTKFNLYPTLETRPPSGDVAFVSQSGALGGAVLSWAEEQGVGFSKFVSYGNAVDLNEIDFLEALREDAETTVVALYVETVSDGRRFMQAAADLAASKPLIVIKSGRGESGGRATQSHTGSLAGSDAVFDMALAECGAIRASGIEEMFDLCRGFSHLPAIGGRRIAVVTNSGGPGVLAIDAAETVGLDVPPPTAALRIRLADRLQPFCSLSNPFDLTVQATGADYRDTLTEVLQEYDAAIAMNVNVPYLDVRPLAHGVCDAAREATKPVLASFVAGEPAAGARPILEEGGVPNFVAGERCVMVLACMITRAEWLRTRERDPSSIVRTLSSPSKPLPWERRPTEPEAMAWMESLGLPVVERTLAKTLEEAVAAQQAFDEPVAMKLVSHRVVHKTDLGAVLLGVDTADAVRRSFERLQGIAPDGDFGGVLISPMIDNPIEAIVGLHRDPQFGPVIVVGLGGIYTEIFSDVALRVAPVSRDRALQMIERLQGSRLLQGERGQVLRDCSALADLVAAISRLPFEYPDILALDLNPVFLFEQGCAIGDVHLVPDEGQIGYAKENPTS